MFRNCLVAASVAYLAAAQFPGAPQSCDGNCVSNGKMMISMGMGGCQNFAQCNYDACTDEEKAAKILEIEELSCRADGTAKPADPVMVGELDCMVPAAELEKFWLAKRNITAEFGNGASAVLIAEITDFCDLCADPLRAKEGFSYQGAKKVVSNMCTAASGKYCASDKGYTDLAFRLNNVSVMDPVTYSYNFDVLCSSKCTQMLDPMGGMGGGQTGLLCNQNQDGVYCGKLAMDPTDPDPCEACGSFDTTTCSETCKSSVTTSPRAAKWGSCLGPRLETSCRVTGPGKVQSFIEDVCLVVDEVFKIEIVKTVMEVKSTISGPKVLDNYLSAIESMFANSVRKVVAQANKVAETEIKVSVKTTETENVPAAGRRLLANNYTYDMVAKVNDVDGVITSTTLSDAAKKELSTTSTAYTPGYDVSVSVVETSLQERQAESDAQMAELEAKYSAAGKEMPASIKSDLIAFKFSGAEARSVSAAVLLIVAATALLM